MSEPRDALSLPEVGAMKRAGTKIVMVTAYDHPSARLASEAGIDLILVGDSAGNNVLGYDTTVPVTLDDLIPLTRGVASAVKRAFVVADMPFGSYETSADEALHTAFCSPRQRRSPPGREHSGRARRRDGAMGRPRSPSPGGSA